MKTKTLLAIAAYLVSVSALSADYRPLTGQYKVGGKTLFDPPVSEPQDTHFYVDLHGTAARDLYRAMKAKPEAGVCGMPEDLTKRNGGIQCTMVHGGKEYYCAFGVELGSQHVVPGVVC